MGKAFFQEDACGREGGAESVVEELMRGWCSSDSSSMMDIVGGS